MAITGFWCRRCESVVDAGHWQPWACTLVPPGLVASIAGHAAGRPATGWSVTELKGCLRSKVIQKNRSVIVDPVEFVKMELGTAWDMLVTDGEFKTRWWGEIGGMAVSGEPDGYGCDVIWDYKNGDPDWRGGGKVREDHQWQVSVYSLLAAQQDIPLLFDYGVIYYNSYGDPNKVKGLRCELLTEREVLDTPVGSDGLTVAGNIALAQSLADNPEPYPLTGEVMAFGRKTACDYCVVRRECKMIEQM